jgi:hypothetical protein
MESALRESQPGDALATLARAMKSEGMSQLEIYRFFDDYRARHQSDADETRYDAILDAMDFIAGWCSPSGRLFDTELQT